MAVLGRSRSGAPPDQILDPPLLPFAILCFHFQILSHGIQLTMEDLDAYRFILEPNNEEICASNNACLPDAFLDVTNCYGIKLIETICIQYTNCRISVHGCFK